MLKTGFKSTVLWRKKHNWNIYCLRRKLTKASGFSVSKYLHYELKYIVNNYASHILWYYVPTFMLWMLQWNSRTVSMHTHYLYQLRMYVYNLATVMKVIWYEWSTYWLIMFCYFQFLNKDPAKRPGSHSKSHSVQEQSIHWRAIERQMEPPQEAQMKEVSGACSVLVSCHNIISSSECMVCCV